MDNIFLRLNRGLQSGGIVLLVGAPLVGKSRLLKQLALVKLTSFDVDQLAGVRLQRPKKLDTGRYVSTVTLDLFSKLFYDLRRLFVAPLQEERDILRDKLQEDPRRQIPSYADDRFFDLFYRVSRVMSKMRGLLIDNAQFIDQITLEQVMELLQELQFQLGVVLCVQLESNEKVDQCVKRMLGSVPQAKSSCIDIIEVPMMQTREFADILLPTWLDALDANFSPQVKQEQKKFIARAWMVTRGDWFAISSMTTEFKNELDQQRRSPRLITEDIANRVFERRLKILSQLK